MMHGPANIFREWFLKREIELILGCPVHGEAVQQVFC
jgi:hypothetical protein